MSKSEASQPERSGIFPQTQWTIFLNAQDEGSAAGLAALDHLGRAYWRPLYAYVRGLGYDHHRASDEVQGFFESFISRSSLKSIDRSTVRFRSFLVACLKNWIASGHRREFAMKRGAGAVVEPLHELASGIVPPVADAKSPEEALDRAWAQEVFHRAFSRLEKDAENRGRDAAFVVLRPVLLGADIPYAALAAKIGVPEGSARKMAFDLRARLGQFLREEVAATVATSADLEDELRYLLGLL
jgi:DNA-directed RNA polymerase specialized sigma24 family protein